MITGKTMALNRWAIVGKVMSLLFNMLSRLVIAFHPRTKMDSSKEDSGRLVRHVTFSFDFSQTILIGGGLLVPYSLPGPPVIKQLMQIATVVLDQDGRFIRSKAHLTSHSRMSGSR